MDLGRDRHRVDHAVFSPDAGTLLAAYQHHDRETSSVVAWDLAAGAPRRTYRFDTCSVNEMVLSPDGRSFATRTWGGVIRQFDLGKDGGEAVHEVTLRGTDGLAYAPDGRTLAVAGTEDLKGETWAFVSTREAGGGKELSDVRLGTRPLKGVWSGLKAVKIAYSPDGRRIAFALANREVVIR